MRPVSVFANGPGNEIEQLRAELHGRWRQATRAVMILLSLHGLPPSQIADLLDCHPATVRRWISRFSSEGLAGLADRPRCGRPRLPAAHSRQGPILCRVAIRACSEAPRTRRASTTDTPPLVAFIGPGWTRSEVPTTLCDSLLPNSCASEFRAVSARAARRHPRAVLRRHYAVRDWAPFEHLGLL